MSTDRKTPLVLLADDDFEIRRIVRRALSSLDCEVIEADDGDKAIELVITEQPDLVILDVVMPTINGWRVCQYIREHSQYDHVAVVMLTGIGELTNAATAPLYGADAHLDKPFDLNDVVNVARKLLEEGRPTD